MIELEDCLAGNHISSVIKKAIGLAEEKRESVRFSFNETDVVVNVGDMPDAVLARWEADREAAHQALIASPEYKERERLREIKEVELNTRVLQESAQTETEMREAESPWPRTEKQLAEYVNSLANRAHDYGTCVYAMSLAATAAFNYMAHKLGTTGFQASCADLDFVRRTRSIKGPFILLKGEDCLYPQYDLAERLCEAMESWKPWLKEQAVAKLEEDWSHQPAMSAHSAVRAHWEKLAR